MSALPSPCKFTKEMKTEPFGLQHLLQSGKPLQMPGGNEQKDWPVGGETGQQRQEHLLLAVVGRTSHQDIRLPIDIKDSVEPLSYPVGLRRQPEIVFDITCHLQPGINRPQLQIPVTVGLGNDGHRREICQYSLEEKSHFLISGGRTSRQATVHLNDLHPTAGSSMQQQRPKFGLDADIGVRLKLIQNPSNHPRHIQGRQKTGSLMRQLSLRHRTAMQGHCRENEFDRRYHPFQLEHYRPGGLDLAHRGGMQPDSRPPRYSWNGVVQTEALAQSLSMPARKPDIEQGKGQEGEKSQPDNHSIQRIQSFLSGNLVVL